MKILLVTDIHNDYNFAHNAWHIENPDLVLDCGDHEELRNISELTPHYFVHGNHEPLEVTLDNEGFPMPYEVDSGMIYTFTEEDLSIKFAGVGGNYSSKLEDHNVNKKDIENLSKLNLHSVDILLLHESPFNVSPHEGGYNLAQRVIEEIKRIKPYYVFAGHTGKFRDMKIGTKQNSIKVINLDDIAHGYGVLENAINSELQFRRVISKYRG